MYPHRARSPNVFLEKNAEPQVSEWGLKSWIPFGSFSSKIQWPWEVPLHFPPFDNKVSFWTNFDEGKQKQEKTRCNCRHVFNNLFLWPRNDPPCNPRTHPWCQNIGFPGPSSCPSQRRSFPRAAVPVAVAPVTCTAFNGSNGGQGRGKGTATMKLTWQTSKTNKTSPLPLRGVDLPTYKYFI